MKTIMKALLLVAAVGLTNKALSQSAPELVFKNPVLKSGTANKEGAVYRFPNVANGVDAELKLKKFSSSSIVMKTIDKADMGWDKALQPEFGLPGTVQPNQHWYIDFEMSFYEAGKSKKVKMSKVDLTAIDVDGDGLSIAEYTVFEKPDKVNYSTTTYLLGTAVGLVGQLLPCGECGKSSKLVTCSNCKGSGINSDDDCGNCKGSGKLHDACDHAYQGVVGTTVLGPVENFFNIDTAGTQVMAMYQYKNVDRINFRYGAKSGAYQSRDAGIRLNSVWFRQFSLAPRSPLPVKLTNFNAVFDRKNVNLAWTGHEENFSHYVIQRSVDGKEYKDIALVFANGNGQSSYQYKDPNVSSATGSVFYRLQLIDKVSEAVTYSDIKVIRLTENQELKIIAYPNPVTDQLRLTLPAAWQGKPVIIELFSANGTRIRTLQVGSASQTENLQFANLSKGFYLVKANCDGAVAEQRVMKH